MKRIFFILLITLPLSLFSQSVNRLKMYPDPYYDRVVVENAECVKVATIKGPDGKIWFTSQYETPFEIKINVSQLDLNPGDHYILEVLKMDGTVESISFFKS